MRETLGKKLADLERKPYGMLKATKGRYDFGRFALQIDHIQGDPFAEPSRLRLWIPASTHGIPTDLFASPSRSIALRDMLTRHFAKAAKPFSRICGSGKSGLIGIDMPGQEVLERSSMFLRDADELEVRFTIGMPADGRRILGHEAARILCDVIPELVETSLVYRELPADEFETAVKVHEDADWLREHLRDQDLIAFVANGSILPRASGVDDRPLGEEAKPFQSPPSLQVAFDLPNRGRIEGMGIRQGITLIVGGGYHGKSTVLRAIERGVYNHVPGDGREFVVTHPDAMKIRSEDGRQVTQVTITPFINNLPYGRDTHRFDSANASGSTSQAANIVESIEAGAKVFLIDEDTSATNFMIRDRRMQELIAKEREPITPFTDKVRHIWEDHQISTVLVMGGSGDYFEAADTVIAMENYLPSEVTAEAKRIAKEHATGRRNEGGSSFGDLAIRRPRPESFNARRGKRPVSLRIRRTNEIEFGESSIDLSLVEQLVHPSQLRAIGLALVWLGQTDGQADLPTLLQQVSERITKEGIDAFSDIPVGNLCYFRPLELACTINRMRTLNISP